jgi:hypothetical protein
MMDWTGLRAKPQRVSCSMKFEATACSRAKVPCLGGSGWARGQAAPSEASALTMKTLKSVAL